MGAVSPLDGRPRNSEFSISELFAEDMFAIVLKFSNAASDIVECPVPRWLSRTGKIGIPPVDQLLD